MAGQWVAAGVGGESRGRGKQTGATDPTPASRERLPGDLSQRGKKSRKATVKQRGSSSEAGEGLVTGTPYPTADHCSKKKPHQGLVQVIGGFHFDDPAVAYFLLHALLPGQRLVFRGERANCGQRNDAQPQVLVQFVLLLSPLGMAKKLMATRGCWARLLYLWMARAARSLPEPLLPVSKTDASESAIRSSLENRACMT